MYITRTRGLLNRRKGASIVESIILMIILLVAIGAIFQTIHWAQTGYAFGRQDRDSREVLFSWAETFESVWPTKEAVDNPGNEATLVAQAHKCVETTGNLLGTYAPAASLTGSAHVGGFSVAVTSVTAKPEDGRIDLVITIGTAARPFVNSLTRSYNIYKASDDLYINREA